MSMFDFVTASCGKCGTETEIEVVVSVNADRRPDLREQILDGSFQAVSCPSCAARLRIPPEFVYLDMARGQWIAAHPADTLARWPEIERTAAAAFDEAFGAGAPAAVRDLAGNVTPSVVFGWPALRERLLCADLDLEVATLEVVKMAIIAEGAFAWVVEEELRLVGGDDAVLRFELLVGVTESPRRSLEVPRAAYDAAVEDPAPWVELRALIAGSLFIDVRRALVATADASADNC
jgi:hypothetical protein